MIEDAEQLPNWRLYTKLRTQLYPYIDAAAYAYRRTGLPIMRHLVLASPDDPEAIGREHDYLFGPDLLAAPVVTEGATTRDVYLTDGLWLGFEMKLGSSRIDEGASNLLAMRGKLAADAQERCRGLVVVVADSPTYRRPDGVIVTSIAAIGP